MTMATLANIPTSDKIKYVNKLYDLKAEKIKNNENEFVDKELSLEINERERKVYLGLSKCNF